MASLHRHTGKDKQGMMGKNQVEEEVGGGGGGETREGRGEEPKLISENDSDANTRRRLGGTAVGPRTAGSCHRGSTTEAAAASQENISQQPPLFSLSLTAFHQSLQTGAEPPPPPPLKPLRLVYLYMDS